MDCFRCTQLKILCIKEINTTTTTTTTTTNNNNNPKGSTIWKGSHVRKLVTFVIRMAKLVAKNKPVFYMRVIMIMIMVMMMLIIIIIIVIEN